MVTLADYKEAMPIQWCPGCGNFGILAALKGALVESGLEPWQVLLVSGIGQAGKLPHYLRGNVLNELHGRALPAAAGAKIANHELNVIAVGGDGDGYGEGGNHFIAAMNRNVDITYIVHNNQVYGLTKGQPSPTSDPGFITRMTPRGSWVALHPLALAVAADCSFVARGFAGDVSFLQNLIQAGISHQGFALIEVLQPCVSFNKVNTYEWYRQRIYALDGSYDPTSRSAAFEKALEWGERIPVGIIYKNQRPIFEKEIPVLKHSALFRQPLENPRLKSLIGDFI